MVPHPAPKNSRVRFGRFLEKSLLPNGNWPSQPFSREILAHVSNLSSKTTIKIQIKSLNIALIRKTKRTAFKMPFS